MQQLRELIKDLWYRNRQEKEAGDLEFLKKKIEILGQYSLTPRQISALAIRTSESQEAIGGLIESGKLVLEGQEPKSEKDRNHRGETYRDS